MKQKGKKEKRISSVLATVLVILSMLVGLALLLYPTVADRINQAVNGEVIETHRHELQEWDDSEYEAMLRAAREYNERLFQNTPYIGALTEEERTVYESLLDGSGNGVMGYIEIEKPHIYLAIYHGTSESVLRTGVGHLEASSLPLPGESVHTVLSGHSGLPSARLFTDLDQLEIGDTFTLHILRETLTYRVETKERVHPDKLKDLWIEEGQELCTLMTCTPLGMNTHRLVITGRRIETPNKTPEAPAEDAVGQAITSEWNRWFVFLPVVIFAGTVVGAVVFFRRKKRKMRNAD